MTPREIEESNLHLREVWKFYAREAYRGQFGLRGLVLKTRISGH